MHPRQGGTQIGAHLQQSCCMRCNIVANQIMPDQILVYTFQPGSLWVKDITLAQLPSPAMLLATAASHVNAAISAKRHEAWVLQ